MARVTGVRVDSGLCVGSGTCVQVDPAGFHITDEGWAVFVRDSIDTALAEEAAEVCPVSAITLVYED